MSMIHKIKQIITKKNRSIACLIVAWILLLPIPTLASDTVPPPVNCNGTASCNLATSYLQPTLDLLSGIVGIVVVISLIMGGIEYSTSEGDPQKSAKAKRRITNTLFALIAYFFLYAFLQFLIPGGLF
jgi:hypothetical protein